MEFKVSELEQEPIEFDLEVAPGAVDFGQDAEQDGPLTAAGRAEVIHEHRGPRRLWPISGSGGTFQGSSRFLARGAWSR